MTSRMNGVDLLDLVRMQRVSKPAKSIQKDISEQLLIQVKIPHLTDLRLHEHTHQPHEIRISKDQSHPIHSVRRAYFTASPEETLRYPETVIKCIFSTELSISTEGRIEPLISLQLDCEAQPRRQSQALNTFDSQRYRLIMLELYRSQHSLKLVNHLKRLS